MILFFGYFCAYLVDGNTGFGSWFFTDCCVHANANVFDLCFDFLGCLWHFVLLFLSFGVCHVTSFGSFRRLFGMTQFALEKSESPFFDKFCFVKFALWAKHILSYVIGGNVFDLIYLEATFYHILPFRGNKRFGSEFHFVVFAKVTWFSFYRLANSYEVRESCSFCANR